MDSTSTLPTSGDLYVRNIKTRCSSEEVEVEERWNVEHMPSGSLEGHKHPITQVRLFEDSIIAGDENGYLYKFNARTLEMQKCFAKHREAITQMHLCAERKVIYTTSLDGYFKKTSIEVSAKKC